MFVFDRTSHPISKWTKIEIKYSNIYETKTTQNSKDGFLSTMSKIERGSDGSKLLTKMVNARYSRTLSILQSHGQNSRRFNFIIITHETS